MAGAFRRLYAVWRGLASLALFAAFGAGSLLLTLIVLLLREPSLCQPVMRAFWKLTVFLFKFTGLISVDCPRDIAETRGSVIVANHPSLIDVVLLTVLVPRTLSVAKHALLGNPFVSAIVRHATLPDDERLPAAAAPYLAAGWNVLVFPEGTRSAGPGQLRKFHRGAAQLALRANAPVICTGIVLSRAILGKGQKPWDMGDERVRYSFRFERLSAPMHDGGRGFRPRAMELTDEMRRKTLALMGAEDCRQVQA